MSGGSTYRPRRASDRHPDEVLDAVVIGAGLVLLALGAIVAFAGLLAGADHALFRALNRVPVVLLLAGILAQAAAFLLAPLAAAVALVARGQRLALELLTVGLGAWALVEVVAKPIATRPRPGVVLPEAILRADVGGTAFPATHLAVAGALAVLASPVLPRWGRIAVWAGIAVIALGRAHIGAEMPSDLVAGLGLGVAVAGAWRFLRR